MSYITWEFTKIIHFLYNLVKLINFLKYLLIIEVVFVSITSLFKKKIIFTNISSLLFLIKVVQFQ